MIQEDDDLVRGVGFVTIYSAFLEGVINELLSRLSVIEDFSEKIQREPISSRVGRAKKIIASIKDPAVSEICELLDLCSKHFEWRNEIVHSLIKSPDYHVENLQSLRPNVPARKVDPKEMYMLANNLNDLRGSVSRLFLFEVPRLLSLPRSNA